MTTIQCCEYISSSPEETFLLGKRLGTSLPQDSVIALYGDLAAGKTTFVKGVTHGASGCHPDEVTSPTFVFLNIYEGGKTVYHFDLYRLTTPQDFLDMGFDEYFFSQGLCCVEWAENIENLLPSSTVSVSINHIEENKRRITIQPWSEA
jgi:tRNA threonylcarbamoyladenosine biosynthesis protein TsaE